MNIFRRRRPRTGHADLIERLLGPAELQVSCEECFVAIDEYVELEAAGVDAASVMPRMRAHLDGCRACREEHDDLLAFMSSMRASRQ